jgi:hypothetical protein
VVRRAAAVTRRLAAASAAAAITLAAASGCADFDGAVTPSGGAPDVLVATPSFTAQIVPIFEKRCSIGGCHSLAVRQGGLVLTADAAYDAIVGVPSALVPGVVRVLPSDPDASWLVTMIGPDDAARRGFSRMPLATPPLTANQIANIVRWIEQGAQRN